MTPAEGPMSGAEFSTPRLTPESARPQKTAEELAAEFSRSLVEIVSEVAGVEPLEGEDIAAYRHRVLEKLEKSAEEAKNHLLTETNET